MFRGLKKSHTGSRRTCVQKRFEKILNLYLGLISRLKVYPSIKERNAQAHNLSAKTERGDYYQNVQLHNKIKYNKIQCTKKQKNMAHSKNKKYLQKQSLRKYRLQIYQKKTFKKLSLSEKAKGKREEPKEIRKAMHD